MSISTSSRRLLTKIYDLDIPISLKKNKNNNNKDFLLIKNRLKSRNKTEKRNIINKTEKENKINKKLKLENINKTLDTNKFPVIPKLNIKNIKKENDEIISNEEIKQKNNLLEYKLIESSSEDSIHKLKDIKNGSGWQSSRFCEYPQYIYIQFTKIVLIKKIEIIIHEKYIPSILKIYSYYPKEKNNISNYKNAEYILIGLIKTNSNENNNYKIRENCIIYPNKKSLFIKLELDTNYINIYNLFNQIGIIKLNFYGEYLEYIGGKENNNNLQIKYAIKKDFNEDIDLIGICDKQLNELKKQMKFNIEIENYMECKEIKYKIEKIKYYGKKVYDLESEKNIALNNEDYSKVLKIKNLVDKMKIDIINISNINTPRYNNNKLLLSDRYLEQNLPNKIINPLIINTPEIQRKPKIYKLNIINTETENNNIFMDDENNNNNINNIILSHDDIILPSMIKKDYMTEEDIIEKEKGNLEYISQEILEEYIDITNILGEENMKKIFSEQILWKEEGLNILLNKLEDIISNNNNNIISSLFKLLIELIDNKHPSIIIKIFEIINNIFNYIKTKKIKINLEKNILNDIMTKIKQRIGDTNIKIRAKAVLLYYYLITTNFYDFNINIEELLNNNNINKSNINLIIGKIDIIINILNNYNDIIKMKLIDKNEFPCILILEYLINNLNNNNNNEIRTKSRLGIKLFLNIYTFEEFKKYFDNINKKELNELIIDIPELQNYYPNNIITIKGYKNKSTIEKKSVKYIFNCKKNKRFLLNKLNIEEKIKK